MLKKTQIKTPKILILSEKAGKRYIMKKDVMVTVSGTQTSIEPEEPIEIISKGTYYKRDGKIYIKYTEITEEDSLDCMIKIEGNDYVEIVKKGTYGACLIFKNGESCLKPYNTPFGTLMVETVTEDMIILEDEDKIIIKIRYALNINYDHVSMCEVEIKVEG